MEISLPVACPLFRIVLRPHNTSDAFAKVRKAIRGNNVDGLIQVQLQPIPAGLDQCCCKHLRREVLG